MEESKFLIIAPAIAACLLLAFIARKYNLLDRGGCIAAFFLGVLVSLRGDLRWLTMFLLLMIFVHIATRFKFEEKEKKGVQEGKGGMRGYRSILGNGMVASAVVVSSFFVPTEILVLPFLASLASACSDVFGSEIGSISDRTRLITNFKKVKAGTNGGISPLGEGAAALGSFLLAALGLLIFRISLKEFLLVGLLGFLGCQIDSVLGATVEDMKIGGLTYGKESVNITSILIVTILAFGL
jgi:uncharacterized protein (TIGR00297 family)